MLSAVNVTENDQDELASNLGNLNLSANSTSNSNSNSNSASNSSSSLDSEPKFAEVKPDPDAPRLVMSKMVLRNFKSYAGSIEIGPFHKVGASLSVRIVLT
jgi:hypothetical protein